MLTILLDMCCEEIQQRFNEHEWDASCTKASDYRRAIEVNNVNGIAKIKISADFSTYTFTAVIIRSDGMLEAAIRSDSPFALAEKVETRVINFLRSGCVSGASVVFSHQFA